MDADRPAEFRIPDDNRPAPLRGTALPFFDDGVCQMSFGERAALAGVLSALEPSAAVEVGTYEGGSLRILAEFAERVHTIDLFDLVPDHGAYPNVTFRTGDSAAELPALLSELADAGTAVDFALIDGDHSSDGVHRDLHAVLGSPACASAVIVLHDTMNPEVRNGIERAELWHGAASSTTSSTSYRATSSPAGTSTDRCGAGWASSSSAIARRAATGTRPASRATASRSGSYTRRGPLARTWTRRSTHWAIARPSWRVNARRLGRSRELLRALEASLSWRLTAPLRAAKRRLVGLRR